MRVDITIALLTLGTGTIIDGDLTALGTTKYRVVSMDLLWTIRDHTAGEGPIEVGIANGDLSNTEIGEALDANPTSPSDIVTIERTRRPVRIAGLFPGLLTEEALNDGKVIRTKLRTILDTGIELIAWVRNDSGAMLTTGTVVGIHGTVYGYWA